MRTVAFRPPILTSELASPDDMGLLVHGKLPCMRDGVISPRISNNGDGLDYCVLSEWVCTHGLVPGEVKRERPFGTHPEGTEPHFLSSNEQGWPSPETPRTWNDNTTFHPAGQRAVTTTRIPKLQVD